MLSTALSAYAETVYIPIDFGGSAPTSYTESFLEIARNHPEANMLNEDDNEQLIRSHFIDVIDRDDHGLKDMCEAATNAYFDGQNDVADEMFKQAFAIATENPEVLALSTSAADNLFQAGAFWLQIHHFVNGDQDRLIKAMDTIIRVLPNHMPSGDNWPDEIASVYRERMPAGIMGHEINVSATNGCHLKVNGEEINQGESIRIYSGDYAFAKICGREITRVTKINVLDSVTFDYDSGLYPLFDYYKNKSLQAKTITSQEQLSDYLVELGRILKVDNVIGVGYVPSGHPFLESGFTAILIDTNEGKITRARTAPKDDISTTDGMQDFVNTVFMGGLYQKIEGGRTLGWVTNTGIVTSTLGAAALIAGGVLGGLTYHEDSEFKRLQNYIDERANDNHLKHAQKRDTYKKYADILYGAGGGVLAIGLVLVLVDQLYLQPHSSDIYRAELPNLLLNVDHDATNVGLSWTF